MGKKCHFTVAKLPPTFKEMHFAVAPWDMREAVVPWKFRSKLKNKHEMTWHKQMKKHKNTAKTIENRTWRHLAAFQARLDAPLDRCFMSVSFVSSSVAMLKFSGLIGTKLLVGLIWCICSVIVGLLCLNTSLLWFTAGYSQGLHR